MEKALQGKTALVTGGGRGLGRSMAIKLASAGALVAVNYAGNREAAEATVAEIERAGGRAFPLQGKLGGLAGADELVRGLDAELGRLGEAGKLDILVNNIGGGDYGTILDIDEATYDQIFDNNVKAAFFLTRTRRGAHPGRGDRTQPRRDDLPRGPLRSRHLPGHDRL